MGFIFVVLVYEMRHSAHPKYFAGRALTAVVASQFHMS